MRAVVFAYSNVGDRCLRVLCASGVDVALVVTHRDRPAETIWFRRVADTAAELGLRVMVADDPASPELAAAVALTRPDLIFSFYYRALIPTQVLELAARARELGDPERGERDRRHLARDDREAGRGADRRSQHGADPARRHRAAGL
jgi:hypothetical protein